MTQAKTTATAKHNPQSQLLTINDITYDLADHTPMMVQFLQTKAQYPHALLLYRMGDFYELFFEDAKLAADLLDITLTRRGNDKAGNEIPMAGVPFHAADSYMARLIAKGQTVVICEQLQEKDTPDGKPLKGIMKRDVVRTLTAGTITDEALILTPNQTPSVVAIEFDIPKKQSRNKSKTSTATDLFQASISNLDLSAGQITCQNLTADSLKNLQTELATALARFEPNECLVNENLLQSENPAKPPFFKEGINSLYDWLATTLNQGSNCPIIEVASSDFSVAHAPATLCQQFGVRHIDGLGIADSPLSQATASALIHYARHTQQRQVPHVNQLIVENSQDYLIIDDTCQRNLEMFSSVSQNGTTLIKVLNHCQTPMGKRLLPQQLKRPLRNRQHISLRADAVEHFINNHGEQNQIDNLRDGLTNIADIERISSRISLTTAKPRDLKRLAETIREADKLTTNMALSQFLSGSQPIINGQSENKYLNNKTVNSHTNNEQKGLIPLLLAHLPAENPILGEIAELLERAIVNEPPAHIRDGDMIKQGYDAELDRLTHLHDNVQDTLDKMAEHHRAEYNLPSLKVGFNKVSGFYFELPIMQADLAPITFIRRQTLKSCERYITDELKQLETDYLNAQSQALAREKQLYAELLADVASKVSDIQQLSQALAQLDVLINWAWLAKKYQWHRPTMSDNVGELAIIKGRHLVVEAGLIDLQQSGTSHSTHTAQHFVANDCVMGDANTEALLHSSATQDLCSRSPKPSMTNSGKKSSNAQKLLLITGPNMGGKSTYMRQVALIVLLASCGSFVPADTAIVGDIDRIFTRIGSADDLAGGKSTFMVEMIETAHILNLATEKSLVLMDEVGRGTSTTDGLAMAYACVNRLAEMNCLTLFATHYFELTTLAEQDDRMRNVHVVASEVDGKLLLLHQIKDGSASSSFGLHVAKMAGVPHDVLEDAKHYLNSSLQSSAEQSNLLNQQEQSQPDLFTVASSSQSTSSHSPPLHTSKDNNAEKNKLNKLIRLIEQANPDEMTPRQALEWLYHLKDNN